MLTGYINLDEDCSTNFQCVTGVGITSTYGHSRRQLLHFKTYQESNYGLNVSSMENPPWPLKGVSFDGELETSLIIKMSNVWQTRTGFFLIINIVIVFYHLSIWSNNTAKYDQITYQITLIVQQQQLSRSLCKTANGRSKQLLRSRKWSLFEPF